MTKHTTNWPDALWLPESFGTDARSGRKDAKIAGLLQEALDKQHHFDRRKAAV